MAATLRTCPCVKTDRCGPCGINVCIPHNVVSVASCAFTCCAPAYKEPPSTVIRCLQPCNSRRITFDFSPPSLELNKWRYLPGVTFRTLSYRRERNFSVSPGRMYESQLFSPFAPIGRLEFSFVSTRRSNDEKQMVHSLFRPRTPPLVDCFSSRR